MSASTPPPNAFAAGIDVCRLLPIASTSSGRITEVDLQRGFRVVLSDDDESSSLSDLEALQSSQSSLEFLLLPAETRRLFRSGSGSLVSPAKNQF
jgi:hypothetical protein